MRQGAGVARAEGVAVVTGARTGTSGGRARPKLPTQGTARVEDQAPTEAGQEAGGAGAERSARLDRLAALAAQLVAASAAWIAAPADDRVLGRALPAGLEVAGESELVRALSAGALVAGGTLVIDDLRSNAALRLPLAGAAVSVRLLSPGGEPVASIIVYDVDAHAWTTREVGLLEQLADAVCAELELAALTRRFETNRARWELAIDAAGIGGFDWDLVSGRLSWDQRLLTLFGYAEGDFDGTIDAFNARLHAQDSDRVARVVQGAIDSCGMYEAEYRIVLPDGTTRWVQARGRALGDQSGAAVRLLGVAYETTGVRQGEARVARVLESMTAAFYSLDRDWRFTYVNAEAERLLGRTREELLGGVIWQLLPEAVGSEFESNYRTAVETGQPTTFTAHYPAPLEGWFEIRAWPAMDGLSVYFHDITAQRLVQERAQRAAMRATLLASVTSELAGTLDAEEAVARLARVVVPALADWCVVTLVDGEGDHPARSPLRDIGSWHADPAMRPVVKRYTSLRLDALTDTSFVTQVLATGRPVILPTDATERIAAVLSTEESREVLSTLAPESAVIIPLRAHGRTLGVLSLFCSPGSSEILQGGHLETAREVADRAGLALDNARLYGQQRRLAEGLQRSLLTAPPQPDHLQIVVRYKSAAQAAQVGGDWYDAFLQPDGATVLVIGDVVGHDTEAAAAMGQVRGLLRGIAATTGDGPAAVLSRLDAAMDILQVNTTATAVVARLEQNDDERARGVSRLRWSNAGHPPPMAINAGGGLAVLADLAGIDADLLLGIDPNTSRDESQVTLDRNATVLLYTDGLVERRGQSLDQGLTKLRETLAALPECSLDELCDEVLARMLPARPDDDVALVAVRLHGNGRSRPAEAGPPQAPHRVDQA